jgi:hypothetical protein
MVRVTFTIAAVAFLCSAAAATTPPDASAMAQGGTSVDDILRVKRELLKSTDVQERERLWSEVYELEFTSKSELVHELLRRWRTEGDPTLKQQVGEALRECAAISKQNDDLASGAEQNLDVIVEVATNGQYASKQIAIPTSTRTVSLHKIETFDPEKSPYGEQYPWVIRRMTSDRVELWLPHKGWLFDGTGKNIATALPPRKDGVGREWYGAFLTDGRWATTDLSEMDCVLYLFGRDGRKQKEIQSWTIVPPNDVQPKKRARIAWCRADRSGKAYVVGVGGDGGRGVAWVSPNGPHRILKKNDEPWQLCYPRDLQAKGLYVCLFVPSEDGQVWLRREEPGHGPFVGFPTFHWDTVPMRNFDYTTYNQGGVMIPEGGRFGFWPGSHSSFVTVAQPAMRQTSPTSAADTWFFDPNGYFVARIAAEQLADGTSEGSMLFSTPSHGLVMLDRNLRVTDVAQFQWPDGETAFPYKIFADLRIGFFNRDEHLVLARW